MNFIEKIIPDFSSAVVVSFLTIAGGAAFGILTGLGAEKGILSMVVASLAGWIFGGIPIKAMGPTGPSTSTMLVIIGSLQAANVFDSAIFLVVAAAGIIVFLMSLLNIKKIMSYVPNASTAVFINGVSLIILVNQVLKLRGYFGEHSTAGYWNFGIGAGSILILILWKNIFKGFKMTLTGKLLSGSLIVMLIGGGINFLLGNVVEGVNISGSIIPTKFNLDLSMITNIPVGLFLYSSIKLALVLFFVTVISTRALTTDDSIYNSELRNLGFVNIVIASIGGVSSTIGFIRSKMLADNDAQSVFAGIATSIVVLLLTFFATPFLKIIPVSVFSGILIFAAWSGIDWQFFKNFKKDPIANRLTFFIVLIGSISMIWLDQILVVIVTTIIWHVIQRYSNTAKHCTDLESCPIAMQSVMKEI